MRVAIAAVFVALIAGAASAETLLIHGGPIYTGVAARPTAEAVVVQGERIAFVGDLAEARRRAAGARDIDLKGAAAYPGFIDAHAHLVGIGLRETSFNLEGVASLEALLEAVKARAAAEPGKGFIVGRGWLESQWPERRFPTRQDLDSVVSDRPVWLERADGHGAVGNSAALALAGVTRDTPPPAGGEIVKDVRGEPTGMLVDGAIELMAPHLPKPTAADLEAAVRRGAELYASRGWTGMATLSETPAELAAEFAASAKARLPIRLDVYPALSAADRVLDRGPYADDRDRIRVMGVKLYADGALGSRGAALFEPYADAPGSRGLMVSDAATIAPVLQRARHSGAQVATHAIGDRGVRETLNWYEAALGGDASPRWRIEHSQIVDPADQPRYAKLGVIASMQPSHAIGDLYFAPARLGDRRLDGAYAWRSLLDAGAVVAGGSDAPVEVGSPLIEFYAAVARKDLLGRSGADWRPHQAVSRAEALRMLTWAPAYAARAEADRGTLETGKLADLSVFSKDLMTAPERDILKAEAVLTIVGGELVYRRP